jgi:hypothetical protein
MIGSLFVMFLVLEKRGLATKLYRYILFYFLAQLLFTFVWNLVFAERINNMYELWQKIRRLDEDKMYDIIAFNIVFIIANSIKLKRLKAKGK